MSNAAGSDQNAAEEKAEEAARSPWVERLGTMGIATHGVIYLLIAAIAGSVGFGGGGGGGQASSTGAISRLADQSYGTVLLAIVAVGLAGYGLLRLLQAFTNPDGEDGLKGALTRASYVIRFFIYGGLTFYTLRQLFGGGGGGGGSETKLTGQLLELPGGRFLVGIVALVMLGVGAYQLYSGVTQKFMDRLGDANAKQTKIARILGTIGHLARGVVFGTVGVLFARAALQSDSSEAGGVDKAIDTISSTPAGPWVLTVIALGLACYGAYNLALARWGIAKHAG